MCVQTDTTMIFVIGPGRSNYGLLHALSQPVDPYPLAGGNTRPSPAPIGTDSDRLLSSHTSLRTEVRNRVHAHVGLGNDVPCVRLLEALFRRRHLPYSVGKRGIGHVWRPKRRSNIGATPRRLHQPLSDLRAPPRGARCTVFMRWRHRPVRQRRLRVATFHGYCLVYNI